MVCLLLSLQDAADVSLPLKLCSLGPRVFWSVWAWSHSVPLELQTSHALNIVFNYYVDSVSPQQGLLFTTFNLICTLIIGK